MKKFSDLKQDFDDIELAEGEAVDRIKQRHARQREQLALKMKAELDRERERESDDVKKIKESEEFEHLNAQIDAANAALDLFEAFDGTDESHLVGLGSALGKAAWKTTKFGGKVAAKAAKVGAKAVTAGLKTGFKSGKALVKKGSQLSQRATKFAANKAAKSLGLRKQRDTQRNLAAEYRSSTGRRVNEEFSDAFSSASFQKLLRHGLVEKSEIVRLNIALAKIDNGAFLNLIERELVFTILEKLILFISEDPIIFQRVNQGVIKNISGTSQ